MNSLHTLWTYTLLVASLITIGLAYYAWKRRLAIGTASFAVLMLAVAIWSLGDTLRLVSGGMAAKLFWTKFRYFGIVVVPITWLIFVLRYTGRHEQLTRRNIALLIIEPVSMVLLVWTNQWHHLIWLNEGQLVPFGPLQAWKAPHGAGFWIHAVYSYILFGITILLLWIALRRSPRLYRAQAGLLLLGTLVPLLGNVLSTFNLIQLSLDLTPITFTIIGLLVIWDILRFRLFDIVPVARWAVVESMSASTIILDMQNRIIDLNPAAEEIIGQSAAQTLGQPIDRVLTSIPDLIEQYQDVSDARTEIPIDHGKKPSVYEMHISPLHDQRGQAKGRIIILYDITERKKSEETLVAQKQLFENLVALGRAAAKPTSLKATLQSTLNMAVALTGAEDGSLFLLDGQGDVTHSILARRELSAVEHHDTVNYVMKKGLSGWVLRHRRPALVPDTAQDDRWTDLPNSTHTIRSVLSIPIVSGSAVLSVLNLHHSEPNYFTSEHAFLLQSSTDQIMLAMRNAQMYDEQRLLAQRQTTLYNVLRTVGEHLDPGTTAHVAVEAVARMTGWLSVIIFLPDETEACLMMQARAGELSLYKEEMVPVRRGVTGRAYRTTETQYAPDVRADPDFVGDADIYRCELAVPLKRGERVLGVLDISTDQLFAFTPKDIQMARSLADAIALALDNARLYTEIRQYATDLSALYNVARSISRSLVLKDVLQETLNSAIESLSFQAGLIALSDSTSGQLHLSAAQDLPVAMAEQFQQDGLRDTLCVYTHTQQQILMIGDLDQNSSKITRMEEQAPQAIQNLKTWGLRAITCIPLMHQEQSLGVLSLFSHQPRDFSAEDETLHTTISRQIATAITNARLFQVITDERSRLQALIESSRDGILLIGMDKHVLVANAQALDMLNLAENPEAWIHRPVQDVLTALRPQASQAMEIISSEIRRIQAENRSAHEDECEIPPRTVHFVTLPVIADETLLGRLLVLRDVTEERIVEGMREDLIHAMVHDLRNPLTAIYGSLSFLNDIVADSLSDGHRQLWDIARENTDSMLKLIKAILDISRLESRQMPLNPSMISLGELIASVKSSQLPLAVEKEITLESDWPANLPPAWGDLELLERVLQNLVGNALKFTPINGTIRITVQDETAERSKFLISVSDTGPGIPPDVRERLFQKFVTGQQEGRGSGLGLAFCRMVLESHGEQIWVESTSEEGTTFAFTLPLPPSFSPSP